MALFSYNHSHSHKCSSLCSPPRHPPRRPPPGLNHPLDSCSEMFRIDSGMQMLDMVDLLFVGHFGFSSSDNGDRHQLLLVVGKDSHNSSFDFSL